MKIISSKLHNDIENGSEASGSRQAATSDGGDIEMGAGAGEVSAPPFMRSATFTGPRPGCNFKAGDSGVGYYADGPADAPAGAPARVAAPAAPAHRGAGNGNQLGHPLEIVVETFETTPPGTDLVFCGICLESKQPDATHAFSGCGHAFCRTCLQAYAAGAIAASHSHVG